MAQKTLKRSMLKKFGGLAFISLFVLTLVTIIVVVVTNNKIIDDSEKYLQEQTSRHATDALNENAAYINSVMKRNEKSIVNMLSVTTGDTFRSGYSHSLTAPSYFDYGDTYLFPPLTIDDRQTKPVSFGHSSYYGVGATPSDISSFTFDFNNTRDRTTHVDNFFVPIYDNNFDAVALYAGFSLLGRNFFRHYPGTGTLDSDPLRTYDPETRSWFVGAISTEPDVTISSPYRDFFGKGWMITMSSTIRDPSGDLRGVVGVDILIETLNENLRNVRFLESGKLTMFETTGIVVSDRDWDINPSDPTVFRYSDLTTPAVSESVWNNIKNVGVGDNDIFDVGEYSAYVYHMDLYDGKYILVAFVNKNEIHAPIDDTIDEIKAVNRDIGIGLSFGSLIIVGVVVLVVLIMIHKILDPFSQGEKGINKILENLGPEHRNLGEGVSTVHSGFSNEHQNYARGYTNMVQHLQEQREVNASVQQNQNYGQIPSNIQMDGGPLPAGAVLPSYAQAMQQYVQPSAPPATAPGMPVLPPAETPHHARTIDRPPPAYQPPNGITLNGEYLESNL